MPIQTDPFDRQRRTASERMSSEQEGRGTSHEHEVAPQKPAMSGGAGPQEQPQRWLNLVTLPADHRHLRGRY